jgi:hypothetical protein
MHADDKGDDARVSLTVQIPADSHTATFGLLLQSAQPLGEVRAELQVNAKVVLLSSRKSGQGLWYWYGAELGAGSQRLEFMLHLPAGLPAPPRVSGWLRVRRKLASRELDWKFKPGQQVEDLPSDPLPASSDTERKTYRVFDEDLQ